MNSQNRIDRLFYMLDVIEREVQQLKKDLFQHHVHVHYETSFDTIDYDAMIVDVFEDYGIVFYKVQKDDGRFTNLDSRDCVLLGSYDDQDAED